jgi:hypothetical protein
MAQQWAIQWRIIEVHIKSPNEIQLNCLFKIRVR